MASKGVALNQKREHHEWKRQWFQKFEKTLDNAQNGPLWLKDERIAKEIAKSLHYRDAQSVSLRCLLHDGLIMFISCLPHFQ